MNNEKTTKVLVRYVIEKAIESSNTLDYDKGFHSCFVDKISKFVDEFLDYNDIEDACLVTVEEYAEVTTAMDIQLTGHVEEV